jgi:hypothetical protein
MMEVKRKKKRERNLLSFWELCTIEGTAAKSAFPKKTLSLGPQTRSKLQ